MITNVQSRAERHETERARIPFTTSVELSHQDFDDEAFEADAVDLSSGGLALRSPCLPDIGEQLVCRFEALPGGARVESRGEVVWTQAGGARSGEFGLRFVDIDSQTRALIDEMIAERKAEARHLFDGALDSLHQLGTAELQVAGIDAPLSARILRTGGGEAVFEQRMDLLELGRAVVARAGSALGKGSIADVALRMDGETPTLAVTVRFEQGRSLFGEFDWESPPQANVQSAPDDTRDTVPDLEAPKAASQTSEGAASRVTVMEFEAANPGEDMLATPATHEDPPCDDVPSRVALAPACATAAHAIPALAAKTEQAAAPQRLLVSDDDAWAHPLPEAARSSALVRLLRIVVAASTALRTLGELALTALRPQLTQWLNVSGKHARHLYAQHALPLARSVGFALLARVHARPRRTTTAPAAQRKPEHEATGVVRLAVIGVLAACAIGLGVYAVAPAADESVVPVHRKITRVRDLAESQPPTATAQTVASVSMPPSAADTVASAAPVALPTKINPAYASAMSGRIAATPASAQASAAPLPASSPYAVDVRDATVAGRSAASKLAAPATKTAIASPSFGAKIVSDPQRFVLRMTSPVKALSGTSDRTGFTVVVPGALSLDRASPISQSHKAVARAMVLNKGDHSELTIRFVDGKSPAFRVSGRDSALEVLIAQ